MKSRGSIIALAAVLPLLAAADTTNLTFVRGAGKGASPPSSPPTGTGAGTTGQSGSVAKTPSQVKRSGSCGTFMSFDAKTGRCADSRNKK